MLFSPLSFSASGLCGVDNWVCPSPLSLCLCLCLCLSVSLSMLLVFMGVSLVVFGNWEFTADLEKGSCFKDVEKDRLQGRKLSVQSSTSKGFW
ncbi:hypothetical protein CK203_110813 [Vitis vinifera]|uniref:Uncharacterized protein n=1 Tax=Vitis vinifera TaxID=29760 RepID=A0A438C8V2_VITVI|nr:hypothetical protein CK203_110813 [Vitis vinifera]